MKTREEVKEALLKKPNELTKDEISFLFFALNLRVKEYQISKYQLWFELHYKRIYLIKIKYSIERSTLTFWNEYLDICDGCHGISMPKVKSLSEIITLFFNYFADSLLANARYKVSFDFDEDFSPFCSEAEAEKYFEIVSELVDEILSESKN